MKMEELNALARQITLDTINGIKTNIRERYQIKPTFPCYDTELYEYYQERIKSIMEYEIRGKPDTFIEAACMCEALVRFKCVAFDTVKLANDANVEMYHQVGMINYNIALDVALAMIQKTSVYEEKNGKWVEIPKHLDNKIKIPTGIIPNATLRERIIRGLACRDMGVKDFSTFEFSNILHLLYLYNK